MIVEGQQYALNDIIKDKGLPIIIKRADWPSGKIARAEKVGKDGFVLCRIIQNNAITNSFYYIHLDINVIFLRKAVIPQSETVKKPYKPRIGKPAIIKTSNPRPNKITDNATKEASSNLKNDKKNAPNHKFQQTEKLNKQVEDSENYLVKDENTDRILKKARNLDNDATNLSEVKDCATCMHLRREECAGIKRTCIGYKKIPQNDSEFWPKYGDATKIKLKKAHFH